MGSGHKLRKIIFGIEALVAALAVPVGAAACREQHNQLFQRSTRQVRLSDFGAQFLPQATTAFV